MTGGDERRPPEEAPTGPARWGNWVEPAPEDKLLTDPQVPERRRWCSTCGEPVGRAYEDGTPGRTEGFCRSCGSPFSFRAKLAAGDLVADRYEVLGCLARGGRGWLYLARDRATGDHVVLKGLLDSADAQAREAARVEQQALTAQHHPGIVRIVDFVGHETDGSGGGTEYIVMEYVAGPSLRELAHGGITLATLLGIVRDVAEVLDHLHGGGLLYCDMKPDNVIVGPERVTLVDLGGVRRIDDDTTAILGTPGYQVAREEIDGVGVTVRSDVFTLGRTLEELLRRCSDAPDARDPSVVWESVRRLAGGATADYDRRYPTARHFAGQIDAVLRDVLAERDDVRSQAAASTYFAPAGGELDTVLGRPLTAAWWLAHGSGRDAVEPESPRPQEAGLPVLRALPSDTAGAEDDGASSPGEADGPAAQEAAFHDEWRRLWQRGVAALAEERVDLAAECFEAVWSAVPGEAAPKLALGLCHELRGEHGRSRRFYAYAWRRDAGDAAAAFGLARALAAGGERGEAVHVLDGLPALSPHRRAAEIAAVRLLCGDLVVPSSPLGPRPPAREHLASAVSRLQRLGPPGTDREREGRAVLSALVWSSVLRAAEEGRAPSPGLGGGGENTARAELHEALLQLAAAAATPGERSALRREAEQTRPRRRPASSTLSGGTMSADRKPAGQRIATADPGPPVLSLSYRRALPPGDRLVHVVVGVRRQTYRPFFRGRPMLLEVTLSGKVHVTMLEQVLPDQESMLFLGMRSPFRIPAPDGSAFHLEFDVRQEIPASAECAVARLRLLDASGALTGASAGVVVRLFPPPGPTPVREDRPDARDRPAGYAPREGAADVLRYYAEPRPAPAGLTGPAAVRGLPPAAAEGDAHGDDAVRITEILAAVNPEERAELVRLLDRTGTLRSAGREESAPSTATLTWRGRRPGRQPHQDESVPSRMGGPHRGSIVSRLHSVPRSVHDPHGHRGPHHGGEPPWHGGHPPERPETMFCETCGTRLPATARYCNRCGAAVRAALRPGPAREPSLPYGTGSAADGPAPSTWSQPAASTGTSPPAPVGEHAPAALPPLAGARIWCPGEGPAREGAAVTVCFAFAAAADPDAGERPLDEPVALRILLESDAASVHPVTRLAELGRDRTTEAAHFHVTPEQAGVAELVFSVYRDRDGQLLQRVRAGLPVVDAVGTGVR